MKINLLLDLPFDVLVCELLLYLPFSDALSLSLVNKQLHSAIDDEDVWEGFFKACNYPHSLLDESKHNMYALTWKQYILVWETYIKCTPSPCANKCGLCFRTPCKKHWVFAFQEIFADHELNAMPTDYYNHIGTPILPIFLTGICMSCAFRVRLLRYVNNTCSIGITETSVTSMKFKILFEQGLANKITCCLPIEGR